VTILQHNNREKWKVQHLEGNRYAFRSHHGKLLCAERNHSVIANRDKVGPWETWELTFLDL